VLTRQLITVKAEGQGEYAGCDHEVAQQLLLAGLIAACQEKRRSLLGTAMTKPVSARN